MSYEAKKYLFGKETMTQYGDFVVFAYKITMLYRAKVPSGGLMRKQMTFYLLKDKKPYFTKPTTCFINQLRRYTLKNLTILLFLLLTVIGCSAENPLCTDNYCVTGEIFPRSDLEIGAEFSEVAIDDSQIFAVLAGVTPVETTPAETTVTLADIVSDVADGGTTYFRTDCNHYCNS